LGAYPASPGPLALSVSWSAPFSRSLRETRHPFKASCNFLAFRIVCRSLGVSIQRMAPRSARDTATQPREPQTLLNRKPLINTQVKERKGIKGFLRSGVCVCGVLVPEPNSRSPLRNRQQTKERRASVRLGHKTLRTFMKRSSLWYLPGDVFSFYLFPGARQITKTQDTSSKVLSLREERVKASHRKRKETLSAFTLFILSFLRGLSLYKRLSSRPRKERITSLKGL